MAKKKESNFAAESAAQTTQPSSAMVALFAANPDVQAKLAKLERRNTPQMVKPGDIPVGGVMSGEIVRFIDSPSTTVKGKLIWLRNGDVEFTFPCTGVIRNALAPGKDGKELDAALEKEIGKTLYAKRTPDKTSAKYKKSMFMFDVYTSDK